MKPLRILAIDLGTSRLKAGVVDERLQLLASASRSYETISTAPTMAEQRVDDWLDALEGSVRDALAQRPDDAAIDAVVLTAQMPTLVTLDDQHRVLAPAITWQDARADALVADLVGPEARRRLREVAGTPIDGRYIIPMYQHQRRSGGPEAAIIVSAKDFLFLTLTGRALTDPSTASGFASYSLDDTNWSGELLRMWGVAPSLLPAIAPSNTALALTREGARLLPGVDAGTPVYLGAADSVCAHHFVTARFGEAISIIDGSSTVIMATLDSNAQAPASVLVTPLVDGHRFAAEMDLLATGSSIMWLATLLGVSSSDLEALARAHPHPSSNPVTFHPYLAGGEQGALWRSDLSGRIDGLSLTSSTHDIARALFEGIAFETLRCVRVLEPLGRSNRLVSMATPGSLLLGATLLATLASPPVFALGTQSPSLLGAALIVLDELGDPFELATTAPPELAVTPLADTDAPALIDKARRYLSMEPS